MAANVVLHRWGPGANSAPSNPLASSQVPAQGGGKRRKGKGGERKWTGENTLHRPPPLKKFRLAAQCLDAFTFCCYHLEQTK